MKRVLSLALACTLLGIATIAPANAQEPSTASGSVQLAGQTSWVTAGQPFDLDLKISSSLPSDQVDLVVTVSSALPNRSSFSQTLANKTSGSALIVERRPLAEVTDESGIAHISLPVSDVSQRRYLLKDSGVFPVKVEIRETGTSKVIDQLTTHLINQPSPPPTDTRLQVAIVLPLQTSVSVDPKSTLDVIDEEGGNEAATLTSAITPHPDLPVTLAISPESLEKLALSRDQPTVDVTSFVAATQNAPVLSTSWSPIPSSLYEEGLLGETERQLDHGNEVIDSRYTTRDEKTFLITDPLDANALFHLHTRGIQRLVVPEHDLASQKRDTTLTRPFAISLGKGKGNLAAIQADNGLADHFSTNDDPILAAHQMLADMAVIWNDRPGQQREVVVMPKRDWTPDGDFLHTIFTALQSSPILTPVSIDKAFQIVPEGGAKTPTVLRMAPISKSANTAVSTSRTKDARQHFEGFASMVEADNSTKYELERRLLYSESSLFDAQQRNAQHDAFKSQLDRQLAGIHMPPNRSIQLTARKGEIPVSIENDTGYPVTMRLTLESNQLHFPDGNSRLITVGRQSITVPFAVGARTSGAFPLQVKLESPDKSLTVVHSRIVVRSTSASGIGIVISIGAGTFLVLWWARSLWKSRRKPSSHE